MKQQVRLRIVLEKPPAGVDFGLQKGSGRNFETVDTQRSSGADLEFECTAMMTAGGPSGVKFSGPFVQGPAGGKFLYLDIGACAGQTDTPWSRRLKIPLAGIPQAVLTTKDPLLEGRVAGSGKDQSPSCGTAKSFAGWKLKRT